MNKFVSFLIVLLAIAVATPVLAEDRLTLGGELRVRGWYQDNPTWDKDAKANSYFDQRFRINGKLSVAEGVSVNFRQEMNNGDWGTGNSNSNSTRAWLNIQKGIYDFSAGKFYYGIGNNIAVDVPDQNGAVLAINKMVEIGYFKLLERQKAGDDDLDLYTLALKHSTDLYSGVVFGGFYRDGSASGGTNNGSPNGAKSVYLIGAQSTFNLDMAKLNVELNYFTGDNDASGAAKVDYKGMQAYVDASAALTETVTAGASFFYAQGQKGTDRQVTHLTNDGNFLPETYGFMALLYAPLAQGNNGVFDPTGQGKGAIGGQVYSTVKLMDDFSVAGVVGYVETDEKATNYDSFLYGSLSARYTIAKGTNLSGVVSYTEPDGVGTTVDDAKTLVGFRLNVVF